MHFVGSDREKKEMGILFCCWMYSENIAISVEVERKISFCTWRLGFVAPEETDRTELYSL